MSVNDRHRHLEVLSCASGPGVDDVGKRPVQENVLIARSRIICILAARDGAEVAAGGQIQHLVLGLFVTGG